MKNGIFLLIGVFVGAALSCAFFVYEENTESTKEILEDIALYKAKTEPLSAEIAKYSSGLYPTLLKTEKAVYDNIIAALEEKKVQLVHRITFSYPKTGQYALLDKEKLNKITHEIDTLKKQIEEDEKESALYSPCLMKSLIDTRRAQRQLTLARLESALVFLNYNIPLPIVASPLEEKQAKPDTPRDTTHDNEAL